MREIKFRVFNHGIKKMYPVWGFNERQIQWANEDGSLGGSFYYGKNNKKAFTLLQYTGLSDKNGTPIYEGDLFHLGDSNIKYVVEWHDCGLRGRQTTNKSAVGLDHWRDRIEVVGNIYEIQNHQPQ